MEKAPIIYFFSGVSGSLGGADAWLGKLPEDYRGKFAGERERRDGIGPGKEQGLLISAFAGHTVEYNREIYDWKQIGAGVWIGIIRNHTSNMFAKADLYGRLPADGYPVLLGDGQRYVIPVALADTPNYNIPWREGLDDAGGIIREVAPEYRAVCAAARVMFDAMTADGEFVMDEERLRLACANAVSVNYRLDLRECLALGLFTSETYMAIVEAILDMPGIRELLKKKAEDTVSTGYGETDG